MKGHFGEGGVSAWRRNPLLNPTERAGYSAVRTSCVARLRPGNAQFSDVVDRLSG